MSATILFLVLSFGSFMWGLIEYILDRPSLTQKQFKYKVLTSLIFLAIACIIYFLDKDESDTKHKEGTNTTKSEGQHTRDHGDSNTNKVINEVKKVTEKDQTPPVQIASEGEPNIELSRNPELVINKQEAFVTHKIHILNYGKGDAKNLQDKFVALYYLEDKFIKADPSDDNGASNQTIPANKELELNFDQVLKYIKPTLSENQPQIRLLPKFLYFKLEYSNLDNSNKQVLRRYFYLQTDGTRFATRNEVQQAEQILKELRLF